MSRGPIQYTPKTLARAHPFALAGTELLDGNQVDLLVGGQNAFPRMLDAIERAAREVFLESYIFAGDHTGAGFKDALVRAAGRGCDVRVVLDGIGSWSLPSAWLEELSRAGVRLVVYRPVAPWRRRWGWWRRDHRKVLVVDETEGFVGGINIADEYDARTPAGRSWRDLHLRLAGPAVSRLAQMFVRTWNRESLEPERLRWRRPTLPPLDHGATVAIVGNLEVRNRALIRKGFLHAVRRARKTVTVANPYFIPDAAVARALRRAAQSGVDVRVLVPVRSDVRLVDLASRHTFPRLLGSGVRIAEWQGMMHAKAAAVDGEWATVGSYNFDRRSLRFNLEVTANLYDARAAAAVEAQLRDDFAAAIEIDRAEFVKRPFGAKLLSALAYRLRAIL